jgi:DNA-binding Xre family transcriptional regulator
MEVMKLRTVMIDKKKIMIIIAEKQTTRAEICRKAGIKESNLSIILKRGTCMTQNAGRIAAALGVDISEIVKLPKEDGS